jgi:peptide/nickel transport system substrate-binding protein
MTQDERRSDLIRMFQEGRLNRKQFIQGWMALGLSTTALGSLLASRSAEAAASQDAVSEETPLPTEPVDMPEPGADVEFMQAPEADPQKGGVLRTAFGITVSHYDFHQGGGGPLVHAFDNLVMLNMTDGFETIIGQLAESWEISEDGLTYTFKTREGVTFHDGTPFSAEDVVATFSRIVFPPEGVASVFQENFAPVEKVELIDENHMRFVLKHPWAPFLSTLTPPEVKIYSKKHLEENNFDMRQVIAPGTGPFMHKELQTAERWIFERNPNYWNPHLPYVDGLEMLHVPAWADRGTAVLTDQADFSWNVSMELHQEGLKRPEQVKTRVLPHFGASYHFEINNEREPFNDPRVRRAIHLAVSRQNLIQAFSRQEFITMDRWVSHANLYAMTQEEIEELPGYRSSPEQKEEDVAEAKRLLAEAGFPDGFEAEIMSADVAPHAQIMSPAFQDELLTKLNIRTTITVLERSLLTGYLGSGDYDIQLSVAYGVDIPDPEILWTQHLKTGASQNWSRYSNPALDELINKISVTQDEDERSRLFREGMDLLDENPPFFMIGFADHLPMWQTYVHGVVENWQHTRWGDLNTVWMEAR